MRREVICGLDIGVSKISATIGEFSPANKFRLLAGARMDSEGLERGKVLDIEKLTKTIEKIMGILRAESDFKPDRLVMGMGTGCLKVQSYRRTSTIADRAREIKGPDVDRLINNALEMAVPLDHEMLHAFPQEFVVDGQNRIKDPKGMFGSKIAVRLLVISAPTSLLHNLKKCVYNAGYDVDAVSFSGLGSSFAFLTEEEREAGVIFLEIGGGITSVIKFIEGLPAFLEIIPFGGMDIDEVIAKAISIPLSEAKELKDKYGSLNTEQLDSRIILDRRETEVTQVKLKQLIVPAVERILFQIEKRLDNSNGLKYTPSGIVLGGGSFLLEGLVEKIEEIFRLPVKLGVVKNAEDWTKDKKNIFLLSGPIGLIYLDHFNRTRELSSQSEVGYFKKLIRKTKDIFEEYF